ncbi:MAG TPA: DUF2064 domain-containing protein [Streptosporangiales bacterium]
MTRLVAVSVTPGVGPDLPGVGRGELRLALLEDTCDVVAGLPLVEQALVVSSDVDRELATDLVAPGTPVLTVPPGGPGEVTAAGLRALFAAGADEAVLVAGDAPDLPPLLVGKLFRGLGSAHVAVVPAADGGLVALAARRPPPDWFGTAACGLDSPDALPRLRAAAPRRALSVAPGWHRIRSAADLGRLDPDLEGWDATRLLLGSRPTGSRDHETSDPR